MTGKISELTINEHRSETSELMCVKNVLLVSSTRMSDGGVGALFLKDAIADIKGFIFEEYVHIPYDGIFQSKGSFEEWFRLLLLIFLRLRLIGVMRFLYFKFFIMPRIVRNIATRVERKEVESVWLVASNIELILLAAALSQVGVAIRVMVWDSPEYLIKNSKLLPSCSQKVMRAFEAAVKKAISVAVISQNMQKLYFDRYGVNSIVIRHGINIEKPMGRQRTEQEIKVVFAGSLYAKNEWNKFIAAMDSINWVIDGKRISVFFLGRFPQMGATLSPNVILLGEKSFDEALDVMAEMHIGYLPYWFAEGYKLAASTAFPGKLSAYTATGLAIFHHAPSYAEVSSFLDTYPFGVNCASLSKNRIVVDFKVLIDLMKNEKWKRFQNEAFNCELSKKAMNERIFEFISCGGAQ